MNDSPTVARHRVRMALRGARERAELTQMQLAEQMEWSLSKVIRIENGDVTISPNDLRPVLAFLGVTDRKTIGDLLRNAKTARTRQRLAWHQQPEFRDMLPYGTRLLVEYEADASLACYWSALFVPRVLQTPAYAARLSAGGPDEAGPWRRTELAARAHRQEAILRPRDGRQIRVLLDESVLRRSVGGTETMTAQLGQLFRWAADRLMAVRMVPFGAETIITSVAFDLITLDDAADGQTVLYRENGVHGDLVEDAGTTAHYRGLFDQVWHAAVDEEGTLGFLQRRIDYLDAVSGYRRGAAGAHHQSD